MCERGSIDLRDKRAMSPSANLDKTETKSNNAGWKMALAGALSGAASRTLVAPFDRVKLLAQVAAVPGSLSSSAASSPSLWAVPSPLPSSSSSSSSSVARATARRSTAATLRAIYEVDGVRGLFRGNVAALLRTIPYSAVQLSTHDLLKRSLANSKTKDAAARGEAPPSSSSPSNAAALTTGARLAAAAGAGVAAAAVSHPLDTLRLRLALPTAATGAAASGAAASAALSSSSLVATAATVVRTEGFLSLYRGLSAAVLGAAPFSAISLMTFDRLQSLAALRRQREWNETLPPLLPRREEKEEGAVAGATATMTMQFLPAATSTTACSSSSPSLPPPQAPAWEAALAGAFAGAVASTATYPIDTLRRRLQLPTSTSVAGCVGVVPEAGSAAETAAAAAAAAKANSLRSSHTRSLFSAAKTAIRHDGFFSLYRGWVVGRLTFFCCCFVAFLEEEEEGAKKRKLTVSPFFFSAFSKKNLRQAAASWPRSSA